MFPAPRNHLPAVIAVALLGVLGATQLFPNGLVVTAIAGTVLAAFARDLDRGIPLELMAAVLATSQWLVGPALAYSMDVSVDRYQMYVDAGSYFSFAIPATCAFVCGSLLFPGKAEEAVLQRMRDGTRDFRVGAVLLLVSVAFDFARPYAPGGLDFFFHLASQLRYIAAIYFLVSGHPLRWLLIAAALSKLFLASAEAAMFHDLILWTSLLACFWWIQRKRTTFEKILFFSVGFLFIASIQTIKRDYRDATWSGQEPSLFEVAYDVLVERMAFSERTTIENAVVRMNQGWIISAVLRHTPDREPFANGSTILEAVEAALLPRFLAPDKKKAGGQENFRRFTGLGLADSTSMGISPLGEAYANFGRVGSIVFMLVWGMVFGLAVGGARHFGRLDPSFLFWTPLIFYQAIKAETELVVVLNQLSKGAVVAYGCYYAVHHLWLRNAGLRLGGEDELELDRPGASLADIQRH